VTPNPSDADARAPRTRRGTARDSSALIVGTAVNGVLAYVFFALATRTLGAEDAAPVAQLWTYWSASAAVLTFPVQHWIIRTVHTRDGLASVRRTLPRVWALVAALAVVAAAVSWIAREQLFLRDDLAFPLMVAAVTVGAFFVGVVRGRLAGADRFVATGAVIAGENLLRVVLALVVVVAGGGPVAFGLALALGGLAGLAWPSAYRFPSTSAGAGAVSPLGFLGSIAAGSLIAQLVLTGGPVVLAAIGGAPREITALFVALAVFRAPYLLALGLVTQLTGALTELIVAGRHAVLLRVRRLLAAGALGGAVLGAAAGWWLGPPIITLVFDVPTQRPVVALVAAATAVALANLVFTVLLVARQASGALTGNWLAAVGVAAAVLIVARGEAEMVVTWAFLAAEVTAFVLMWVTERRASGRAQVTAPRAPREDRDAASHHPA
jgi:O-antigen/teichoic acid export membrane protein